MLRVAALWMLSLSALACLAFGWDKSQARRGGRRLPETRLWLLVLAGGGVGAWLGMHLFRHKTRKGAVPWAVPLLTVLQLAGLAALAFAGAP